VKVSDLLVRCLENEGVQYVFGVPGEENEDLLFSLEASSIRFVPTRHEQGAAFLANVWGRLTGRLACAFPRSVLERPSANRLLMQNLTTLHGRHHRPGRHHEAPRKPPAQTRGMLKPIEGTRRSFTDVVTEVVRKPLGGRIRNPGDTHRLSGPRKQPAERRLEPSHPRCRSEPDYKAVNVTWNPEKQGPLVLPKRRHEAE
jgi:acetolactate synthase-1/2/3 large subunit